MDLSYLKWPVVIVAVLGLLWLGTVGGITWLASGALASEPGADAAKDAAAESRLTNLGWFCLMTGRIEKGQELFEKASSRYPDGKNYWYCQYMLVKCATKSGEYQKAADILQEILAERASFTDSRVPESSKLTFEREKLVEVHGLEKR